MRGSIEVLHRVAPARPHAKPHRCRIDRPCSHTRSGTYQLEEGPANDKASEVVDLTNDASPAVSASGDFRKNDAH